MHRCLDAWMLGCLEDNTADWLLGCLEDNTADWLLGCLEDNTADWMLGCLDGGQHSRFWSRQEGADDVGFGGRALLVEEPTRNTSGLWEPFKYVWTPSNSSQRMQQIFSKELHQILFIHDPYMEVHQILFRGCCQPEGALLWGEQRKRVAASFVSLLAWAWPAARESLGSVK